MTKDENDRARFETRAVHAGHGADAATGAIMQPVYLTSTYVQEAPGVHKGFEYSRTQNPTRFALERAIAELEGGAHGFAFASGCAAATTVMHLLDPGSHVVSCDDVYGGTYRLFERVLKGRGLSFSFCDLTDPKSLGAALQSTTRLVWLESPTNPLLKVIDIAAIAERARRHGALVVVDNTFLSPAFQRPLELGADIVVHSTTKYLGGHSDVVGGAVVANDGVMAERLRFLQNAIGAVAGPFDSFLTLRGTKTLALRMERHAANAAEVAAFLSSHRGVSRVIYPGLASHPQHALAKRQQRGMGGMVSFELLGGVEAARRFLSATRIFALAESLGGVESLCESPPLMTHASIPPDVRRAIGIADGLIRLSVGVEHIDDLITDLQRALAA
ncbi:MAG: cystathionine gamma-synthase [Deltaproteobacteria bacterium]|nr:cystathionine gamma-synthase [Deltaproteobacteria bacterium]